VIHAACFETADEYGAQRDDVKEVNIAAFQRVAQAMAAFGLV
jgi:glutamate dehydrogenase (NADP+)